MLSIAIQWKLSKDSAEQDEKEEEDSVEKEELATSGSMNLPDFSNRSY